MAEVDPDQEAALRRLRAAFGFIQILRIIDHDGGRDQDDEEPLGAGGRQHRPTDSQLVGGGLRR